MVLPIVAYGDPVLRKETAEIPENDQAVLELISNMFDTMYAAEGVGLAAPQIGKALRLFVIDASPFAENPEEDDDPKEVAFLKDFKRVFINPIIIEEKGDEWGFHEGCLSMPGIREEVFRQDEVHIEYFDENWELKEEKLTGFAARVVQHEYDHIEGVLFTDHVSALKRRLLKRKLTEISKGEIDVRYRMRFPEQKKGR